VDCGLKYTMSLEQTGAERQWPVETASSLDTATVLRGTAGAGQSDVVKAMQASHSATAKRAVTTP